MINRIPKFHEVIELFYERAVFKRSKAPLPRQGQSLEQRQKRQQAMLDLVTRRMAEGGDDSLLTPVLRNLREIHKHLGFVALFPDKDVCATHLYFWLIVWPQLEQMFVDALENGQGSIPLRYLARCYECYGDRLFGDPVATREAILTSLEASLVQVMECLGIPQQRAQAAILQFLRRLGRLIRHDSFPGRTSVDAPVKELELALGRSQKAGAVIQHLEHLFEGVKVLHAAGRWSLPEPRPVLPDELHEVHRNLYQQARSDAAVGRRSPSLLLDRLVSIFKAQIRHVEPGEFLSQQARQVGRSKATRSLIEHNAGQLHAYVLLEQIKSDLHVGRRLQRVENSVQVLVGISGSDRECWQAFFQDISLSLFLLNAIFSSALTLIQRLFGEEAFAEAALILRRLVEAEQTEGQQRERLLAVAAREQISALKALLDSYHAQHHLGWLSMELLAFIYAFKYNYDPGFQPHATDKLEAILDDCVDQRDIRHRIVYETQFGRCTRTLSPAGADVALIMIHQYNRYILAHCEYPLEYLCNPLQRLSEILQRSLSAASAGGEIEAATLKRCINAEFGTGKSKSVMRIGGLRPYECLRDVGFYLSALHLEKQEALNPGLFLYLALSDALQHQVLQLLSPASYAEDLRRQQARSPESPDQGF
ncbi:hypothetical protein [Pseudomonas protegens]|nr:hypothetical protein [Pseudomonas protegens]MBP5114033.1 hypothetical protein [Pseudomonas protegens]QTU23913.1 hypothetical protein HUT21_05955 [Pseudomonas protegens]QTU33444.1 hypothetical protein HUT20_23860 [Pseudomonas protegens]RLO23956.1 hypothetical protein EAG75_08225 [Pseudomonas protegens]VAV69170.1 hypothetical protein PPRCHA0_2868 [Pseudomonas protegens CHA0]